MGFRAALVAAFIAGSGGGEAAAHNGAAPAGRTYVLDGFRLSGVEGLDQDALVATLTEKPGDRITEADIAADAKTLGEKLKARHIQGELFATIAEKKGRVWVLFDFQYPQAGPTASNRERRRLGSQAFEGNARLSVGALEAATGLKQGEDLPVERINAAREAILAAYKKAVPGEDVRVGGQIRVTPDGEVALTWRIAEPK